MCEMDAKTSTAVSLYGAKDQKGIVKFKSTEEPRRTRRTRTNPTADLFYRTSRTYRSWRAAEVVAFLWSDQGDAAA